jgi:carboxyl-terminal processing protease
MEEKKDKKVKVSQTKKVRAEKKNIVRKPRAKKEVEKVVEVKKIESLFRIKEVVVLVLLTCFISLTTGLFLQYKMMNKTTADEDQNLTLDPEIQEFISNYEYIINNYYEDIDKEELINEAIKGMVDSLEDPHSIYMDDEASETFNIQLNGTYTGLGIQITNNTDGDLVILRVFEDSPADKADLRAFDIITKIDNIDLMGYTSTEFTSYVKNSNAKSFDVTIVRDDKEQVITISKELITIKSVSSKTYEENNKKIGYLNVTIFAANTYQQFKQELEKLEKENIDSLIIDLRNNSGGHLGVVKNMISLFLDTSHVIYQTESKTDVEKSYSTGAITKKYPIVVLSNKASASASEVMMGALKDRYGATIIGDASFGKGTVQELKTMPSGGQYKFTTKKWLTPNGYWVEGKGIEPDVKVIMDYKYYEDPNEENDNQLQTALETLKK